MPARPVPPPRPARPLVVAHRGASAHHPENTLEAFDAALEAGADGLELDLQLTADGRVVVLHDATLARVFARAGRVIDVPLSVVETLDAGGHFAPDLPPAAVPLLSDVLGRYHGRTHLFLELKRQRDRRTSDRLLARVLALLPPPGEAERLWLIGFPRGLVRRAKAERPDLPVAWTHASALARTPVLARAAVHGLDGLLVPARHARPATGGRLHRHRKWLLTYACDSGEDVRRALAAGADVLMADDPALLRRRVDGWWSGAT